MLLTTLKEKVDPKHAALLVVDVQNDYCHERGAMAEAGQDMTLIQQMVPHLEEFLQEARRIPIPLVFIRTIHGLWTDSPSWAFRYGKPSKVCRDGTWGTEFYRVAPAPNERIVTKHRYSAFIDTDLDLILRSRGIRSLIMTGVATNVCVESTARDGFMRDYYVVFLDDCCATGTKEEHEATLHNIGRFFGTISNSQEVVKAWQEA
ncbi:MAG: cysteine hydrolase [Deltaproteobacteria bacterium]|nr:cysteine hydrolase [Deltaproteobacteria bacterium]